MEYDSVTDLFVAIPREDEVCYITDDEMGSALPPSLAGRPASSTAPTPWSTRDQAQSVA